MLILHELDEALAARGVFASTRDGGWGIAATGADHGYMRHKNSILGDTTGSKK